MAAARLKDVGGRWMTEGEKEWRLDSTSDEQRDGNERERTRGAERSEERNRGIKGIRGVLFNVPGEYLCIL